MISDLRFWISEVVLKSKTFSTIKGSDIRNELKLAYMDKKSFFSYENKLLILLTFTFGFVLFDRMALNFLVPFFDKELGLNNTQIGLLASLLVLAWAISGYLVG